jgi:hypothetical protein
VPRASSLPRLAEACPYPGAHLFRPARPGRGAQVSRPARLGRSRPRGGFSPQGRGSLPEKIESGDPNPDLRGEVWLTLAEVSRRSGIGLGWLGAEVRAGRIGVRRQLVSGRDGGSRGWRWEMREDEVDRHRLRWLHSRRGQVNDSGRGFRRGGTKYRHDGGPQQQ